MFSKNAKLQVSGMSCAHCEKTVEEGLTELDAVSKVKADHEKEVVTVYYKGERPSIEEVKGKVENMGYEVASNWI